MSQAGCETWGWNDTRRHFVKMTSTRKSCAILPPKRRWAQTKAGKGRVVLISAEPGVGKSRLAEALAERIADEPHTRLRYFCSPHHQDSALYPVIAHMERAAGFQHADEPAVRLAKLQALLAHSASDGRCGAGCGAPFAAVIRFRATARCHSTAQEGKDVRCAAAAGRTSLTPAAGADGIRRSPLDRPEFARTTGPPDGAGRADWPVLVLAMFRPEFQPPWIGQPYVTHADAGRARPARHSGDGGERRREMPRCHPRSWRRSSSAPTACRCSLRN